MKVVAFNGSPKRKGNTARALEEVCNQLELNGIETEIIHVGNQDFKGCSGCGVCRRKQNERCRIEDDKVNEYIQVMKEADGIIISSPTYYASIAGGMKCFLDRAFYVAGSNNGLFRHKVGASVVAVRRAGGVPVFNQLNNYLTISSMFLAGSTYWNMGYGRVPGEVEEDKEGMVTMRSLGDNMAYLLKVLDQSTIPVPEPQEREVTNFIR